MSCVHRTTTAATDVLTAKRRDLNNTRVGILSCARCSGLLLVAPVASCNPYYSVYGIMDVQMSVVLDAFLFLHIMLWSVRHVYFVRNSKRDSYLSCGS